FKGLNGDREKSVRDFANRCKKAYLNQIVDVYEASVEEIVEEENTALIELTSWSRDENFIAPFDLRILKENGVEEKDQRFEYTVYVDALDHSTRWRIELKEETIDRW